MVAAKQGSDHEAVSQGVSFTLRGPSMGAEHQRACHRFRE
jgi:hypothetical protein